ncbi:MAG: hypothetical protein A3D31_03130 [Candidatus Fluviicola riflensis]|nr:MAG: hypothetical protein CHH17_11910 [Candidatus Fluviicola riflensis]OGS78979.1 MAG: hypothetical protein A3D31_03130 [Candidatus Fluviicola riflensis]OGS86001.1 MAG: hypothetical protein A3E30_10615 [Fluviicola sp. RIFCSPHIGHO2_12_FULL_43_24]OGS86410.1 MAG: hypothetical protein A2724_02585 [Fluviicola sp. RIFCSPHIGHO2_01_FULL_43_53]
MLLNLTKVLTVLGFLLSTSCFLSVAQTTIINPNNNTGTSGADGSFQNATNTLPANGWTVVNGATNRWFAGTQSSCVGTKGAYVGTAAGNNNYTIGTADISHFYDDVTFPAGQSCITLTFNWKGQGESGWDGLRIYLGSTAVTPVANTMFTTSDASAVQLGNTWYNLQAACGSTTITIPASNAGTTKRLVFSWQNDASIGTTPAATIDAISLIASNPTIPTCATALVPANLATGVSTCNGLSWTAPVSTGCDTPTSYDVYFGTTPVPPLLGNTTATTYATPMAFSTTYYWQIVPKNAAGSAVGCAIQSFTTGTSTNSQYNLVDDATSASPFTCVTLTPDAMSQRGCAWDANSTLNFLANFSYDIDVNLGANDAGADGVAFVMQNDPLARCKCGTVGGALGAGGITNSVTVEIDTYLNFEDRDDFTAPFIGCAGTEDPDHLDVWFNGVINPDLDFDCDAVGGGERVATPNAIRLQSSPGVNYNIENGLSHKFRISWNAGTTTLTASVWNSALTVMYGTISSTFNPVTVFGTNSPYFGFTGSTGGLSNQQTFCLPSVLLPVEMTEFDVTCEEGSAAIHWETETERDNAYFTLERSCDGVNFQPIKQITGSGTTQQVHDYQVNDDDLCSGVSYYRLSQTDLNGEQKVLGIRSTKSCLLPTELVVFPNPATDELTVSWNGKAVKELVLYDAVGQLIFTKNDWSEQASSATMDVSQLAAGVYYLTVYQTFGAETIKVVVN